MRIITGIHRGRKIEPPKGDKIRPTTDRSREALFNILTHAFDESPIISQTVLDLCCGTGALGLEALSRGAEKAIFIDSDKQAIQLTGYNVAQFKEQARAKIITSAAEHLPRAHAPVSLVFMDPPYFSGLIAKAFKSLVTQGWLRSGTLLAFEQSIKEDFPELTGTTLITQRTYGKTRITLVEFN